MKKPKYTKEDLSHMLLTESGKANLNLEFAWNKVRKSILKFKLFEWARLLLKSLEKSC
jgi:hypothetical protein